MTDPSSSPSSNDDIQELKARSLSGIGTLVGRQVLVKAIFLAGNILLARILVPEVFGVFAIVSFVVQFFSTFGDVGLGAALIQKKVELGREEISTTFWVQQLLVWVVVSLALVAAPLALRIYPSLPDEAVTLIRVMAFSFWLSSLKTIPVILAERSLRFNRIAWVDISENFIFQTSAVLFALAGFEVWSFIFAALLRGATGVAVIYGLAPWRPAFVFRFASVSGLVRFGLPYQLNNLLAFVKEALVPLFLGTYSGAAAVGYVNWAKTVAFAPLVLSEGFGRVSFPAFSRIQEDRTYLTRAVERSVRMMTLVLFPISCIMVAVGPELISVVFTDKWIPGLWVYYLFCTSPLVIGVMLPMYNAILSLGKSSIILKMNLLLLLLEWAIAIPCVVSFGFVGIAFSQPFMHLLFFVVYKRVLQREQVYLSIWSIVKGQSLASVFAWTAVEMAGRFMPVSLPGLFGRVGLGGVVFLCVMRLLDKGALVEFWDYFWQVVGRKKLDEESTVC